MIVQLRTICCSLWRSIRPPALCESRASVGVSSLGDLVVGALRVWVLACSGVAISIRSSAYFTTSFHVSRNLSREMYSVFSSELYTSVVGS